jgi:polyribonucleotide 5'-hydroxyl-kinase
MCASIAEETTNTSFLPGNDYYEDSVNSNGPPRIYDLIQPTLAIQNSILAVTNADPNESQPGIRDSSVLCYVYVSEVDEAKRRVRLLAPTSGRIPARAMILGRWPEDVVDLVG